MTQTPFDLSGKTALVTGCKRGIGMALAIGLAKAGADIVGVSASLELEGSGVAKEVEALGQQFTAYQCDFSDRGAVHGFLDALQKAHTIDILVNNAGTIRRKPAHEHPDEYWDHVIEVNLNAQFVISKAIGASMLKRGGGKIIFTASLLSFQGGITVPGYAASKGGIAQLTKALANEWGQHNVQVNAIAPGYIKTDNTQALQDNPERSTSILARIPAGRWGNPEDLAGACVYLASPASDYVNGHILTVDGGWMAR
jgi:2-deoxy-D-gluconate 3-dehydrogenase